MSRQFVTSALVFGAGPRGSHVPFRLDWPLQNAAQSAVRCVQGRRLGRIGVLQPRGCASRSRRGGQWGFSLLVRWELTGTGSLEDLEPGPITTASWLFDPASLSGPPFPHSSIGDEEI